MPAFSHAIRQRLGNRPDAEHVQIGIRLVLVGIVSAYFLSGWFAARSSDPLFVDMARFAVSVALVVSVSLAIGVLVAPGVSVLRRVIGIAHDIAGISVALYLGEASVAGLTVVYLWAALGNGFRYGNAYLYGSAGLSLVFFSVVVWQSPFWREQLTLSLTLLAVIALLPPYVAALLSSLRRAKEQLKLQATVDVLTGLYNRTEAEMTIERILDDRHEGHALLFCDLDLFKEVNDDAGHAAGDKLLADVARIIVDCIDSHDIAGRLGGDEFCVLLRDSTVDRAHRVAEDIRNRVSGYRLAWGTDYYSVGISIGVAPTSAVRDMASLFRLADAACYAAKNGGRNQVHAVDPATGIDDTQRLRKLFVEPALAVTTPDASALRRH